jgi:hypothetical protein
MKHAPVETCDFLHLRPSGEEKRIRVEITCSLCNGKESTSLSQGMRSISQEAAERAFKNRGWEIGRTRRRDICPACLYTPRKPRPTPEDKPMLTIVETPPPQPDAAPAPSLREQLAAQAAEIAELKKRVAELEDLVLEPVEVDMKPLEARLAALERMIG